MAYKAGHSTETALLSIKNEVHLSLSRGESTALVLLDLSAAFNTIDHATLLSCLQIWFGVGGSVLKWFTSYLTDRYQSIKIGSTLSDVCKLLYSIPHGSVLGPLLFSLYTTPLSLIISKHKSRDHGGRVVILLPPTSEAGVRFPAWPQVGKLVVACRWSAVYSTEP